MEVKILEKAEEHFTGKKDKHPERERERERERESTRARAREEFILKNWLRQLWRPSSAISSGKPVDWRLRQGFHVTVLSQHSLFSRELQSFLI
jgi:hypothetical protein